MFRMRDSERGTVEMGGRMHGNDGKVVEMRAVGRSTVVVTRGNRPQRVWDSERVVRWLRGEGTF